MDIWELILMEIFSCNQNVTDGEEKAEGHFDLSEEWSDTHDTS